ncbi:MAG: hypothetical protein OWQ54_00550 [Sulfolobaceae archaeon]|nr:hypothetical protein [Sulfolobaceae archaeon]
MSKGEVICTSINEDNRLELFSKAKYLVLVDPKNMEIINKVDNPALTSENKRPTFAKECVKLNATQVIAPHGSLCFPSYFILKKANVKIYVAQPGSLLDHSDLRVYPVNWKEILYSSYLAVKERIFETMGKK